MIERICFILKVEIKIIVMLRTSANITGQNVTVKKKHTDFEVIVVKKIVVTLILQLISSTTKIFLRFESKVVKGVAIFVVVRIAAIIIAVATILEDAEVDSMNFKYLAIAVVTVVVFKLFDL